MSNTMLMSVCVCAMHDCTNCRPEQVQHFCFDHRVSFNLLQDTLQRLSKGAATLLSVCMIEILEQEPVSPPAKHSILRHHMQDWLECSRAYIYHVVS